MTDIKLPTLRERVTAILENKTPFDFMGKVFKDRKVGRKCSCGKKAKYLFYDKLFQFSPLIGFVCDRCKIDAEHLGHSGTGYETIPIKEIPKKQLPRVLGVLLLSKLLIQISKPRQFRNLEKNILKTYGDIDNPSDFFKQRIIKHKKMANAIYTILKY